MAIQLPKIDATGPVGAADAPRLDAHPLNTEGPMQMQQQALEGVGKEVVKYHDQIVNQEADNTATDADNKFQDWHKKALYGDPSKGTTGLLYQEGDPKVLYNQFNKEAQDKLDELSTAPKDQDWSGVTQNVVNRRLNKRAEQLHDESLTAYGNQKFQYDKTLMATNVDFAQKAMPLASAQVDPDHPETFGPLQAKIEDIKQPIIQHALQYGGAVKDADGNTVITPAIKQAVSKAVSDGLYNTIDNLYKSGDDQSIKQADAIKEQFADQMDPFHKGQLKDSHRNAIVEQQANKLAGQLDGKPLSQVLDGLKDAEPEVKRKTLQYIADNRQKIESLRTLQEKDNYRAAYQRVDALTQQNPSITQSDIENDQTYKRLIGKVNPIQKKALAGVVDPPPKTDPAAFARLQNVLQGGDTEFPDPTQIKPADQAMLLAHIGKDQEGHFIRQRLLEATNPSMGAQTTQYGHAMTALKTQAFSLKMVNPNNDGGTDVAKGSPEQTKLNDLQLEFGQKIKPLLGKLTPDQVDQQAHDFIANKLKTQNAQPGFFGRVFGGGQSPDEPTEAPKNGPPPMSQKEITGAAIKEFSQTHGTPPNTDELKAYISSKPANYKWKR
jgi:hypothetical protein